ncbi:MAG: hypothetical protein P4L40_00670 [Terracidiphilus sp.]|nr:hypothetical protein [Terracidiphilus sp.]
MTLKEIVLIAAAVVLATGCAFALVTCVCRRRYRRMQMHWMAAYELENASGVGADRKRVVLDVLRVL